MSSISSGQKGPGVVCLACPTDKLARRTAEIEALALELGGKAEVQSVTGRTTALAVSIPLPLGPRFAAALALFGATFLAENQVDPECEFLVVITAEPQHTNRKHP